ncbi:MAG: CAP domain-containing protein [Gaiellaceae bacterium]
MRPLVARRVTTLAAAAIAATILGGQAHGAGLRHSESSLLTVMNQVRLAHGVRPLRLDDRLQRAARGHSSSMLRTQSFAHGAFAARIRAQGVKAPRVGENLAWGVGSLSRARAIVAMWMASPEHRANLLRPGYRTVGVGAIRGRFLGYAHALVVTTDFAGR